MKQLKFIASALIASCLPAMTLFAGPESLPSGKEMKEVAPIPPPVCDWTGFYVGLHGGGEFGHSENKDLDDYDFPDKPWGYSESGAVAGGQFGYNWQWRRLVLGPEFDLGYMSLEGSGTEPNSYDPRDNIRGHTDGDFYTTLRGRVGYALDCHGCWLLYGTGGAIGANYYTRVTESVYAPFDSREENFNWGYTVGGGIERMICSRWSIKVEYLYFDLGNETNTGHTSDNGDFRFRDNTAGHIVRGGLNFHF